VSAESAALPVFVEAGIVAHRQRAGADQTHVAFEDVEELGQFVDACFAEEWSGILGAAARHYHSESSEKDCEIHLQAPVFNVL
jgi:hypothetical protein